MTESNDNTPDKRKDEMEKLRKELLDTGKKTQSRRNTPKSGVNKINGDGNIIGDRNTINNHYNEPPIVVRNVVVKTGDGVLTAAQKAEINRLFYAWADARGLVRKTSAEYKSLRGAFNNYMKVQKYDEIKQEDFDKAIAWIRRQTGIVMSMPSARKKLPDWRKKRYAAIMARAKEFHDGEQRMRAYAQGKFNSGSLKDLDDDQLDTVYRHVFSWNS